MELRGAVAMTIALGVEGMDSAGGLLSLLFGAAPCAMTVAAAVDAIESESVRDGPRLDGTSSSSSCSPCARRTSRRQ